MHPIRRLAVSVWSLVLTLHATAYTPQPPVAPRVVWPARLAYCVEADTPEQSQEIGELLLDALDAWRVEADVEVAPCAGNVRVRMVDGYRQRDRVAETAYEALGPYEVTFARWYWTTCPDARAGLVRHEVGHSVGHMGHSEAGQVMGVGVPCDGAGQLAPVDEELWGAWRVRTRGIR